MMNEVSLQAEDLLTVAGAGAAAFIVSQFFKLLFDLQARWVRSIAMITGLAVVVVVTATSDPEVAIIQMILAVIVGMQAGLSAVALFDAARSGLNYHAEPDRDHQEVNQ